MERWWEHFQNLLNSENKNEYQNMSENECITELQDDTDKIRAQYWSGVKPHSEYFLNDAKMVLKRCTVHTSNSLKSLKRMPFYAVGL